MKTIKTLLCAAFLAAPLLSSATENTYNITINSSAEIQEFINNNEKLFYIDESSLSAKLAQENLGSYASYEASYMQDFLKKNNIPKNITCIAPMIYDDSFINPADITEISVKKHYKEEGHRRLKSKVLVYDIKISGKGLFNSRKGSIRASSLKRNANKAIRCNNGKQDIAFEGFNYPQAIIIPAKALANNNAKEALKNSLALQGNEDYLNNLKTTIKI